MISRARASGSDAPSSVLAWPAVSRPSRSIALTLSGNRSRRSVWRYGCDFCRSPRRGAPGIAKAVHQFVIGTRLLNRIEIGALHILDDRDLECLGVRHFAHHHRHIVELGELGCAPAPLARDDLKILCAPTHRPHEDRGEHTLLLDRGRKIGRARLRQNVCAGWNGLGLRNAVGSVREDPAAASPRVGTASSPMSAESPRPSARGASFFASVLMPPPGCARAG